MNTYLLMLITASSFTAVIDEPPPPDDETPNFTLDVGDMTPADNDFSF